MQAGQEPLEVRGTDRGGRGKGVELLDPGLRMGPAEHTCLLWRNKAPGPGGMATHHAIQAPWHPRRWLYSVINPSAAFRITVTSLRVTLPSGAPIGYTSAAWI